MKTIGDSEFDMLFFVINFVGCKRFERNSFFIKKNSGRKWAKREKNIATGSSWGYP